MFPFYPETDEIELLKTSNKYIKNEKDFVKVVQKRQNDLRPAIVLDVFAGIGAALVALKRLRIAMSKVVHVEHDEIANHVVRRNHDHKHNTSLSDDGIEHVYISTFQEMEGSIDQFLQEHGRKYRAICHVFQAFVHCSQFLIHFAF
jgi:predicted RNA methylase